MNKKNFLITLLISICCLAFSGCNDSEDVYTIFTGKTWKLTILSNDNDYKNWVPGIWSSTKEQQKSLDIMANNATSFTIVFAAGTRPDETGGNATVKATGSTATGTWKADGGKNSFSVAGFGGVSDTDPLGKAFLNALKTAESYVGDSNNLRIYYNKGANVMLLHRIKE